MKLLDAFCGAGGCSVGYSRAGFDDITGVDINHQPHYPFKFIQEDALEYIAKHGHEYDAIHASPPCQRFSTMTNGRWQDRVNNHPDMIKPIRELLIKTGKPYVIENVEGAKMELINPVLLCGTMFGLQTKYGSQLRRHRYFEVSFLVGLTPPCQHNNGSVIGVYGGGQNPARKLPATIGVWGHAGGSSKRDEIAQFGTQDRRDAMGIEWMTGNELSQAIPPDYTEYIGKYLMIEAQKQKEMNNELL
jgi:DNA (cytosine-5)-methyltransferase 1